MNEDDRGGGPERDGAEPVGPAADGWRARALRQLLPALVHRLNNALAVVQLVHDLGPEASTGERAHAGESLLTLRDTLEHLALHARALPASAHDRRGDGSATAFFRTLELLLRPLASSRGVELELRPVALPASADGRLEGLLLDLCVALVCGGEPGRGTRRRMRLAGSLRPGEVSLRLSAVGLVPAGDALAVLAALRSHVERSGRRPVSRRAARSLVLRLALPAPGVVAQAEPSAPRPPPRRLLLLHGAGAQREEVAALLSQNGLRVTEAGEEPAGGSFEFALIEQRLAEADPHLAARLRARLALRQVELLAPRTSPATILRLFGE